MSSKLFSAKRKSAYDRPLSKDSNEIRLLQIHPLESDGVVRCSLEIVSLDDKTPEYSQHLGDSILSGATLRTRASEWERTRRHITREVSWREPGVNPVMEDSMTALVPPRNCVRFLWGDFAALSYVWGEGRTGRIVVDGKMRRVTQNLEVALRATAQDSIFGTKGFCLWVDALCINQNDEEECAHQVGKMADVYGQAWRVIAWLGPAADHSDEAMSLLRHFAQSLSPNSFAYDDGSSGVTTKAAHGLGGLDGRGYWRRLWVIQELVLGREATVVRCGDRMLDFPSFCVAAITVMGNRIWIWRQIDAYRRISNLPPGHNQRPNFKLITIALAHICESPHSSVRLEQLVALSSSRCTFHTDKIFGLLGLTTPRIQSLLAPLRRSPVAEVFRQATVAWIAETKSLEPLRHSNPWGPSEIPSWSIDWIYGDHFGFRSGANIKVSFNAHLKMPAKYRYSSDGSILECDGLQVDRICGLGARRTSRGRNTRYGWSKATVLSPPESWTSAYGTKLRRLLGRCLMYDQGPGGRRLGAGDDWTSPLDFPADFQTRLERGNYLSEAAGVDLSGGWNEWLDSNGHLTVGSETDAATISSLVSDSISDFPAPLPIDHLNPLRRCHRVYRGRRLIFTDGGLFGWAKDNRVGTPDEQVRVGDWVVVLFGCSTPLVVRPEGEHFLVLGEAYLQGMMDGEAVEKWRKGEYEKRTFSFC